MLNIIRQDLIFFLLVSNCMPVYKFTSCKLGLLESKMWRVKILFKNVAAAD
jgi:hypothetical protein